MSKYKHPQFRMSDCRTSSISFTLTTPGGAKLQGSFADFEAMMAVTEGDLCTSVMKMILYSDSVKAETAKLTQSLIGPACLNVSQHRVVTFHSTDWERITENEYLLYGNLSMCGRCKLVVFEVIDHGTSIDASGKLKLSKLEFDCIIKRSDFNLTRNASPSDLEDEIALKGIVAFKSEVASNLCMVQDNWTFMKNFKYE